MPDIKRTVVRANFGTNNPVDMTLASGGGGTHDPPMEARITSLEADMKEVKAILGRFEPLLARLDERTKEIATKTDISRIEGKISALDVKIDERLKNLPTAAEFGELKGKVASLPTTWVLLLFGLGALTAPEIIRGIFSFLK